MRYLEGFAQTNGEMCSIIMRGTPEFWLSKLCLTDFRERKILCPRLIRKLGESSADSSYANHEAKLVTIESLTEIHRTSRPLCPYIISKVGEKQNFLSYLCCEESDSLFYLSIFE